MLILISLSFEKLLSAAQKFQKTFSAIFGELKASSNVTEIKTTLQKLKFILKKIK